jgi:hypothetical protein
MPRLEEELWYYILNKMMGLKQPGNKADHSPPPSAEVKMCSYTSASPYAFMAWCLIKHRDNFIFAFFYKDS